MSSSAAGHCRGLIVMALVLTGCSGSNGIDGSSTHNSTTAISEQNTTAPAPPAASLPVPAEATFFNPLLATGPDPYVIRVNGVYYYTQTSGNRIELWATTAMSKLGQARHITVFVPPSSGPNSHDLWAPELHYLDNKWYVYYAAGDGSSSPHDEFPSQRIFVLENDQPDPMQGTWTDKGRLSSPDQDSWAIDGTVLEYSGNRYFIWSGRASSNDNNQHIYIANMIDPETLAEGRVLLSNPDHEWERSGGVGVNEAPQVLSNRWGTIFLLYSANGCWTDDYSLGMLTLRSGGDPMERADWVKSDQPVFGKNSANGAFGPGHNSFFKSPDGTQDWLIYHANSSASEGCGDTRSPRMQPIKWRVDGTPDFATPAPMSAPMAVPSGD